MVIQNKVVTLQVKSITNYKQLNIMKKQVNIKEVSHEELSSFFSLATYGQPYWSVKVCPTKLTSSYDCREDIWADIILQGGTLQITDTEEDKPYLVDYKAILKGFSKAYDKCPKSMLRIETEEADAWDGFDVMQCILFGEVIYG